MALKIYNTATRQIEEFKTNQPGVVKMYTCGPTVYHFAHIGNLRTYIMEDILEKSLTYLGYRVDRVMNITDVGHLSSDADTGEDKMLKGAKRENKTVMQIAEFYTNAFKKDCERLNIKWPETVVPATSCIDEYINLVQTLLDKGYGYIAGGNVYFDVSKLDEYYSLTNHKAEDMNVGVRDSVEADSNKKNQNDFVLWFTKSKFEDQELKWDSPWGIGYPGWHIECSGISLKYLGEYLDIHCGGVDNIFPHHTNEVAQSESYLGHKWCNYWFHTQHLNTELGKMSKSDGEFTTVDKLIEHGYSPLAYRMYCLQSHYRNPLVFSYERLDGAQSAYNKLVKKVQNLTAGANEQLNDQQIKVHQEKFANALSNDINTSLALTCVYDVLKDDELNSASKIYLIKDFDSVLGLGLFAETKKENNDQLVEYINQKIAERLNAKKEKDYALADSIRNELLEKGIVLKDTPNGTEFEIK
ncbi:MAG: cysteine--tRNA ligase [Clostridiales bacterium]|nr:cysteine--tRNA ligase [Clostridiales bacterium]